MSVCSSLLIYQTSKGAIIRLLLDVRIVCDTYEIHLLFAVFELASIFLDSLIVFVVVFFQILFDLAFIHAALVDLNVRACSI